MVKIKGNKYILWSCFKCGHDKNNNRLMFCDRCGAYRGEDYYLQ